MGKEKGKYKERERTTNDLLKNSLGYEDFQPQTETNEENGAGLTLYTNEL